MSTTSPITEVIVCTTCRPAGSSRDLPPAGQVLFDAVVAAQARRTDIRAADPALLEAAARVQVRGIACMSGCSRACTVALQAVGKPTYYFGDLPADAESAVQVLACADLHAANADGALPRKERPERLQPGILAKLPALSAALAG